jgi:hypothetical protein
LNNDGVIDFRLSLSRGLFGCGNHSFSNIYITALDSNSVVTGADTSDAGKLSSNAVISDISNFSFSGTIDALFWGIGKNGNCVGISSGEWLSTTDGYLGLKLKKGTKTYFGWLRISVSMSDKSASFTVKDYAYNSIANQPILAGQSTSAALINANIYSQATQKDVNSNHFTIAPNPVSNSTTISFVLAQSQKVSLTIYDMNGRLIKTLVDEDMQQGTHQLIWNVRDEKGNSVTTGIYFLKMQMGNYAETRTIVVEK